MPGRDRFILGSNDPSPDSSFLASIDFALSSGLKAVEFNLNPTRNLPHNVADSVRRQVKEEAARRGITLTAHAPSDISLMPRHEPIRKGAVETMKQVAQLACDLGCEVLTVHSARIAFMAAGINRVLFLKGNYPKVYYDSLLKSYVELAGFARGRLEISMENTFYPDPVILKFYSEVIRELGFGLTWDVAHGQPRKGEDDLITEFMKQHIDHLRIIHLHDRKGDKQHLPLGEGEIDFPSVLDLAQESKAIVILEMKSREGVARSVEYFRRHLAPSR